MSPSLLFTTLFTAALVLGLILKLWLTSRQVRYVAQHRAAVPAAFAQTITLAAHQRAADYTLAKSRVGVLETAWSAVVLLGWTLLGGLDALNQALLHWIGGAAHGLWQGLALIACFAAIGALLDLPFTLWQTFRVEQRFGFNRMTLRLWLADTLKGMALAVVIGLPLAALILWLMGAIGPWWWLWAWAVWAAFNLLLMLIYPTFIAPLFNKFTPLEDQALKQRVSALMARCGFAAKGLFVMDGSRRSAHGNAYFTGFGAARRVVFFDTLLKQLDPPEVEAVLAHELGHFKLRHIARRLALMAGLSLAGLALLAWLMRQAWFYTGLGVTPNLLPALGGDVPNSALALILFML
ncbi:MAG: M48 family metallopeptidase, partial [Burkholderiaceae bacterium]|nr:M48 family metallopeptidase [Burkholderiaceae bacterium]